jgi:hypothetical protein
MSGDVKLAGLKQPWEEIADLAIDHAVDSAVAVASQYLNNELLVNELLSRGYVRVYYNVFTLKDTSGSTIYLYDLKHELSDKYDILISTEKLPDNVDAVLGIWVQ